MAKVIGNVRPDVGDATVGKGEYVWAVHITTTASLRRRGTQALDY